MHGPPTADALEWEMLDLPPVPDVGKSDEQLDFEEAAEAAPPPGGR